MDLSNIDVIGVDRRCDLVEIQKLLPPHFFIQGNLDPAWLHLPKPMMETKAKSYYADLRERGLDFKRWVAGLGHGILIQTPEENVKSLVKIIQSQKL